MPLKVAVQMDPVERINIETDTTFLLMMEAQSRGHSLWVYGPERLAMEDGRVFARGRSLTLREVKVTPNSPGNRSFHFLAPNTAPILCQCLQNLQHCADTL